MNRAVQIAIDIASRASGVGFDATVDAAATMRREVIDAAEQASGGLDRVAGAAENMDDKAGRAAGALGALSSGFDLVGLEQYSGALQGAAMAADFFSGVGQTLTLLMEVESFQRAKAAAATVAHTVATTASSAAAKAAAGAQAALNAVLAANPVALVVLAVVALVAAFVIAYRRSETFRDIVQGAMSAVAKAVGLVVDKVSDLVGWVTGKASAAWSVLRDAVTTALAAVRDKFQPVLDVATRIFDKIRTTIGDAVDAAGDKVDAFKSAATTAFELLMTPINAVKDAINWIVDKFQSLKPPDWFNKIPGFGRAGAPSMSNYSLPGASTPAAPVTINLNVTVDPLADPSTVAAAILAALNDYLARIGRSVVVV